MALLITMARFANSLNPTVVVPVASILSVEKQNIPALPNQPASSAQYNMLFTLVNPYNGSREILIKYGQNITQRDTDFAAFETATTQVI